MPNTVIGDRVKETTNTSGDTDPFTLLGAQNGYNAFSDEMSVGDFTYYCVIDGSDWEIGIGELTNATTLTRDTVLRSTNANARVVLSATTKTIFCGVPADKLFYLDKDGLIGDATGLRRSVILADIAQMKALTGVVDNEAVFVMSNGVDDDGYGGMFEYRSGSSATENLPDVATATGMGAGRWHRIDVSQKRGRLMALSAEPTGAVQGMFAYSDGTASTNNFGVDGEGLYSYTGSKWILTGGEIKAASGSPIGSVLPDFVTQVYRDISNGVLYMANGTTASDWTIIGNEFLTTTMDANSQKIVNIARMDFISLGAEPGDSTEGMIAYSDGTASTNGFGQSGEGFYAYNGTAWTLLGDVALADNSVTLAKLVDIATARVLGRNSAGTGDPEALDEATFKAMFNLEIGTDVQAYDADLTDWAGKAAPSGDAVGTTDAQTLTNKILTAPELSLESGSAPTPTAEGRIMWDSDDNRLAIGDGAGTKLFSSDTVTLNRANHTGSQAMATISDAGALATLDEVTASEIAAGAVGTSELADNNVTLPKLQTIADDRILGNITGGAAAPAELTATQVKTLLAIGSGDVSGLGALAVLSEVDTAEIADDAVTYAKLQNVAANSFLGNNTGSSAAAIEMTAAQAKTLLAIAAGDISGLGALALLNTVDTAQINANAVSLDKLTDGTQGELFYYGASGAPSALAVGTAGQFLVSGGPAANPYWTDSAVGPDISIAGYLLAQDYIQLEVDGADAVFTADAYGTGNQPGIVTRFANGTKSVPTVAISGDELYVMAARGYDGAGFDDDGNTHIVEATETWGATAHGLRQRFFTTPNGTVAQAEVMVLENDGMVGLSSSAPKEILDIGGNATIANSGDATAGLRLNSYYDGAYKSKITGYGGNLVFNRNTGTFYLAISSASASADAALSMQNVLTIPTGGNVQLNAGNLFINEKAAAVADVAGYGQIWVKNDSPNKLMFTDDAGTDYDLTAAGASSATTSAEGLVELATTAEVDAGTDAARVVTPDTLAASDFGISYVSLWCSGFTDDVATGDGKAYFHVPPALDGMNLVYVHAEVLTAGTTGTTDVQVHNVDNALDMLSTKLTIDSAETGSDTAAAAAVINASNDHINTNDMIRIDVDSVSTTAPKGLLVTLGFRKP